MQPLSAIDAIAPAFTRTHQTLFKPFKLGRSWKLAASSYLAWAGSFFIPLVLLFPFLPSPQETSVRGFVLGLLLVSTLLQLAFFYLGVRMQFVNFEMVVTRAKFIAPMWNRYGSRIWPWIGIKAALGSVIFAAFCPMMISRGRIAFAGIRRFAPALPSAAVNPQDVAAMQAQMFGQMTHLIGLLLPLYSLLLLLFLVLKIISTLLEDFALPFYILDEGSLLQSIRKGSNVLSADPLQAVLYVCLKLVLGIVGFFVQYFASQIIIIPFLIIGAILGLITGLIAYAATGHYAQAGFITGGTIGYGFVIVGTVWAQIFTLGYLLTLMEAYAIYFVGGRYEKLGDYLEPPTYIYAPPPVPPAPGEDDGPPLPMDPALA